MTREREREEEALTESGLEPNMRGRPTICGPGGTIPAVVVLFTRDRGHNTRAPAVEGGTIPAVVVLFTRDIEGNTRAPAVEGRPTFYQGQEQYRDSKLERSTSIHSIYCKIHQMKKKKIRRSSVLASVREPLTPQNGQKTL